MENTQYKNKKIEFEESAKPVTIIDGEQIQVSHDADANAYSAGELPYRTFTSLKELGEAVVDQRLQDK